MTMDTYEAAHKAWRNACALRQWPIGTSPAAAEQVDDIAALAHLIGAQAAVAGTHTSTSITLPVAIYRVQHYERFMYMLTRDNFYDRKVTVVALRPIELGLYTVHDEYVAACYCEGIERLLPREAFVPYTLGASVFTCYAASIAQQLSIMHAVAEAFKRMQ